MVTKWVWIVVDGDEYGGGIFFRDIRAVQLGDQELATARNA
jgi:hypothetical protein